MCSEMIFGVTYLGVCHVDGCGKKLASPLLHLHVFLCCPF